MALINLLILAAVAAAAWWLTGLDKTNAGDSKRGHHLTRALRCILLVVLSSIFIGFVEEPSAALAIPVLTVIPVGIAITLRSALAEVFARGLLKWIDPEMHDQREFDPKKAGRYQDAIAHLIRTGRREEAIRLCEELKVSGDVDLATLEHTLAYLGVKQADRKPANPLADAAHLRTQQKFAEAEALLQTLVRQNPADEGAALMLMRLYAQDLRQPERAYEALETFSRQPHVDAAHVDFARRSIPEWLRTPRGGTGVPPDSGRTPGERADGGGGRTRSAPVSPDPSATANAPFDSTALEALLAAGSYGSAVELLEQGIKARPMDWALQLKLAELYAVHCRDLVRAEKIVGRLEQQPGFSADLTRMARAKLEEWRTSGKTNSG